MKILLSMEGVAKSFGGNHVLQGVDAAVREGEIVGLLGPNGSGKSTLLNLATGFARLDRGAIRMDGARIDALPTHRIIERGIARTFQLPSMPTRMSVLEVAMSASLSHHGFWATLLRPPAARAAEADARRRAGALLDELLLARVRDLPASALSGGQKKLLGIACALMRRPRLLMLDEPTAGVHPGLRGEIAAVLRRLRDEGMTLVVVEHDMAFVREVCTRCVVLDRGRVAADCRPDELAGHPRVLEAYLGQSAAAPHREAA